MTKWVEVCSVGEIGERNMAKFTVESKDILILRTEEGFFAIDDTCTHAEVSLSEGSIKGCQIECWAHGAVFDVRDGSVVTPPASEALKTYETKIQGDGEDAVVSIKIGE